MKHKTILHKTNYMDLQIGKKVTAPQNLERITDGMVVMRSELPNVSIIVSETFIFVFARLPSTETTSTKQCFLAQL